MSRWSLWVGRVLSALCVLALAFSASFKFRAPPEVVQAFTTKYGYPAGTLVPIGVLELSCALLYAIPQTATLGAILVTSYLGGAVSTHVRASEPWFAPVILGVVAWVALYLRDPRLHELVPLRRSPRPPAP
jgi:hypothetical protein